MYLAGPLPCEKKSSPSGPKLGIAALSDLSVHFVHGSDAYAGTAATRAMLGKLPQWNSTTVEFLCPLQHRKIRTWRISRLQRAMQN